MTARNVGALVVLKSGDEKKLAGIVTERGKHEPAVGAIIYSYLLFTMGNSKIDEALEISMLNFSIVGYKWYR